MRIISPSVLLLTTKGSESKVHVGIDASNIRAGGGLTHLSEMLSAAQPGKYGISKITVWASVKTLDKLPDRSWLEKVQHPRLDSNPLQRLFWMMNDLDKLATHCDLLYIPGGTFLGRFHPFVVQHQNMLPFEFNERLRLGVLSKSFWRLTVLSVLQRQTFKRADGAIYVSAYGKQIVTEATKVREQPSAVISHGIEDRFFKAPRLHKPLTDYSTHNPFRLLYVSIVNEYKHQWNVANAVARLREKGLPVAIDFVGPARQSSLERLNAVMEKHDPDHTYMKYVPYIPFKELHSVYHNADGFVFASTCENNPNIVIEAMASGLPIACSDRSAMPGILQGAGIYFDPEDTNSICEQLEKLVRSPELRNLYAQKAFEQAKEFSWQRCADETLTFLAQVKNQQS